MTTEDIDNVDQSDNMLVSREDLEAMLNVISHSIGDMYNRRNAIVEAINRLEIIYAKYSKENKDANRTQSD